MPGAPVPADAGPQVEPIGERALLLRFGHRIDRAVNARVHAAGRAVQQAALPGVHDIVPTYAVLALHYDPAAWAAGDGKTAPWQRLAAAVRRILSKVPAGVADALRSVDIPVQYGGTAGPDIDAVARHAGLETAEIIRRHCAGEYRVAMLGFAPGFAYLIGLDPALHTPRHATPRIRVPAGSVAIGGAQTGIYPRTLPGGWQIIGRTQAVLFDPLRDPPSLLAAGDRVRFVALDADAIDA
ncbi:MAG TPA: 5-oxoprolinase subunit PxpB [Rhodanobacteraceae bacterium]|nr:5-oxoprolinase subunit PxpB [Rhodanobacteraceae bacterium]